MSSSPSSSRERLQEAFWVRALCPMPLCLAPVSASGVSAASYELLCPTDHEEQLAREVCERLAPVWAGEMSLSSSSASSPGAGSTDTAAPSSSSSLSLAEKLTARVHRHASQLYASYQQQLAHAVRLHAVAAADDWRSAVGAHAVAAARLTALERLRQELVERQ